MLNERDLGAYLRQATRSLFRLETLPAYGVPTDPEALAALCLPVGETAVEISLDLPLGLTQQEVSA